MSDAARLSAEAVDASAKLPPLLAEAERAAASVWGVHGRRASGAGETFWQYRHAQPGDALGAIDWRRSGRSDEFYVRETEWETAQSVFLWPDDASSMEFASKNAPTTKSRRAKVMALAIAVLLERGGERFALMSKDGARMLRGRAGVDRLALVLTRANAAPQDIGTPPDAAYSMGGRAVFLSDFFGDLDRVQAAVSSATARRVRGSLIQIVDPVEEAFPYRGRVLFESIAGSLRYEADRADSLREAYQRKLEERRDSLREIARRAGWSFAIHRTDQPVTPALMSVYQTLQARRAGG